MRKMMMSMSMIDNHASEPHMVTASASTAAAVAVAGKNDRVERATEREEIIVGC